MLKKRYICFIINLKVDELQNMEPQWKSSHTASRNRELLKRWNQQLKVILMIRIIYIICRAEKCGG